MATKDFSARQIRSSQLIASGGIAGSKAGLMIYSASIDPALQGSFTKDPNILSNVGTDVFLFVSGSKESKKSSSDAGNGDTGVTLFGGDVVISGTLYSERMVIEVEEATTGSLLVSGSLFVSRSADISQGLIVNHSYGKTGVHDFIVKGSTGSKEMISTNINNGIVHILSGGSGGKSPNEFNYTDVSFFVSGNIGSVHNVVNKGTSLIGGDLVVSGGAIFNSARSATSNIGNFEIYGYPGGADFKWQPRVSYLTLGKNGKGALIQSYGNSAGESFMWDPAVGSLVVRGAISGSHHLTQDGLSHLVGGQNVTIASASNGQITISSTGGGAAFSGGTGANNQMITADGSGGIVAEPNITFDGNQLTVTGKIVPGADDTHDLGSTGLAWKDLYLEGDINLTDSGKVEVATGAGDLTLSSVSGDVHVIAGSGINLDADNKKIKILDSNTVRGIILAESRLTISSSAGNDLVLDSNSGNIRIEKAGSEHLRILRSSGDVIFQPKQSNKDLIFQNDAGSEVARIDSSVQNLAMDRYRKLTFDGTTSQSESVSGDGTNLIIESSNRVLILSGAGHPLSPNESGYTDTNFFVSGSLNARQRNIKGTAVFGGDLVVSGGLHLDYFTSDYSSKLSFANPLKTYIKSPGSFALDLSGDAVRIGPDISEVLMYNPVDTNFFVSGSIGSKGSVKKGTSTFGGDVVISGTLHALSSESIHVSEYIRCSRDSNSYIRFNGSDTIQFRAGGVTFAQLFESTEDKWQINPDGNDVDLEVYGNTVEKYLIKTNAGNSQVLLLSGASGGPNSPNESLYSDMAFFVSGSRGSKDSGTKGTAVFGGDLVTSGTLYISGTIESINNENSKLEWNAYGANSLRLTGGSTQVLAYEPNGTPPSISINGQGSATSFLLKTNNKMAIVSRDNSGTSNSVLINSDNAAEDGSDTSFFVSGSVNSKGTPVRGTSVFGGDVVVSGSLYARQPMITTHKLTPGNNTACFVRFDSNGSDTSAGVNNKMVTPYLGTLVKVIVRSTNAANSTTVGLHTNTNGNANLNGTSTEDKTVNMSSPNNAYTFFFTPAANWGPGDIVGLKINPSSDPGTTVVTAVWEFETYAATP